MVVVPFEVYASIQVACPILGEFIFIMHTFNEVVISSCRSYFTPKLSTARVNEIGHVVCFLRSGICLHS
jgi:hypothetical protein